MANFKGWISWCVALVALSATQRASAEACRMSIVFDRSGSMHSQRLDPPPPAISTGNTRCKDAAIYLETLLIFYAFPGTPIDFSINPAAVGSLTVCDVDTDCAAPEVCTGGTCRNPTADPCLNLSVGQTCARSYSRLPNGIGTFYAAHACPALSDRLVEVWEFIGGTDPATRIRRVTNGFVQASEAINTIHGLYFDPVAGGFKPKSDDLNCPGVSTPLAEAICDAADSLALQPAGGVRKFKVLSDGENNASKGTCSNANPDSFPTEQVEAKVLPLNITGGFDGTLWFDTVSLPEDGTPVSNPALPLEGQWRGRVPAREFQFFTDISDFTGGRFEPVQTLVTDVSPIISHRDKDGDGIPDYRDKCAGQCADSDSDGIANDVDLCPTEKEDGNLPKPSDGCPDSDYDGVINSLDACPTLGCPAPPPPPVAAAPLPLFAGFAAGAGLLGVGALRLRKRARKAAR